MTESLSDFNIGFPIPGEGGWSTSYEVAAELIRLDPEGHKGMVQFHYTPKQ